MSINAPEENRERGRQITLAFGSLIIDNVQGELNLVYDVGGMRSAGPPIKACHIINEEQNFLAWSGSMYPYQIETILDRVWPEHRIVEAFIHSYLMPREQVLEVMGQIENRGPRTFVV